MALIHQLSETVRKLLVKSRNRIPSVYRPQPPPKPEPVIPPPVAVPQNAAIDIMEPLTIGSGQREDITFRYITGIPAATEFGMEWYANETDPALNRPPLTLRDKPIPTQTFSPAAPQPNTGDFQDGIVSIQAPDIHDDPDGMENFYGRIIIYQV